MNESKIELTERLRASGQWSEAARWKDEEIKNLIAGGMKRAAAREEAWRRMAAKYPREAAATVEPLADTPLAVPAGPTATSCDSDGTAVSRQIPAAWGEIPDSAPLEVEIDWAHQNRALVVEVRPSGSPRLHWDRARRPAPSFGAVSLMELAAINYRGFLNLLVRVKPGPGADGDLPVVDQEPDEVEDPGLEQVLQLLRAVQGPEPA